MSARVGYIGGEPVIVFETYEDGTSLVGHFLRTETTGDGIEYPSLGEPLSDDVQMAAAEPGAVVEIPAPAEPVYGGEAA